MDGECDLKPRFAPAATAFLPNITLVNSRITIDAPREFDATAIVPMFFTLLLAPSISSDAFHATINVNGVSSALDKSNLLLQGAVLFASSSDHFQASTCHCSSQSFRRFRSI
jgi:hypothetical protein